MQTVKVANTHKRKKRRNKKKCATNHVRETQSQHNESEEVQVKPAEKRTYSDDDSDDEKVVIKKKKKNKPTPAEPRQKGAKSIRQQKREKHAARLQEAEQASKFALKSQCMEYLSSWKHNKQNWKFMKAKQHWLFKNKFSCLLVPDDVWPIFLEYFASAQGNIKHLLLEDSKKVIEKMDTYLENENKEPEELGSEEQTKDESAPLDKPDEVSYKRARDILQHLDESG